jgi:hypothetical protein
LREVVPELFLFTLALHPEDIVYTPLNTAKGLMLRLPQLVQPAASSTKIYTAVP